MYLRYIHRGTKRETYRLHMATSKAYVTRQNHQVEEMHRRLRTQRSKNTVSISWMNTPNIRTQAQPFSTIQISHSNNFAFRNCRCNHDQGLEAFKQLVSYMELVENTVPKLVQTFIREQEKRCSKL